MFICRSGLTLEEALQMVYSYDVDVTDVYIEPPDAGELTDEDSGMKKMREDLLTI